MARNPFRSESEMFRFLGVVIVAAVLIALGAWINVWVGVVVAVLAVVGVVWWLLQEPVPGAAEPTPKLASGTPAGTHRVLVVAPPGTSSVQVGDAATEVVVVVPALASKLEAATGAVDDRRADAEQTAQSLTRALSRDGRSVRGEVGADNPVLAVEDALRTFGADAPLLVVDDTMAALEALGRAARRRATAQIVGVTGSVGKTGTKEALKRVFERQGTAFASAGSLNNQWGVPLSLARMPRETAYGVFEMGMNHPGEIDALTRLVRPHVAVITTVEPAHLGFFPSVEAIADAKAEIFAGLEPGGAAILNRDNAHFPRLAAAARNRGIGRILGFGAHPDATVKLVDSHLYATASAVTAAVLGEIVDYCIAIPGQHWVMNSLAVLAAVKAAGGDVGAAAAAFSSLTPLDGRGRRHRASIAGGEVTLIDESYNASPASMRAAFAVLGVTEPGKGGRRVAILGDMLELGEEGGRLHAELAQPLAEAGIDLVFTVGSNMRGLYDALPKRLRGGHAASSAEMAEIVARRLRPGDVVTVKGSFGSRMAEVVKRLLAGPPAVAGVKG